MQEIFSIMPVLAIAMVVNIALGTYYNIGVKSLKFNYKKLLIGIAKAGIVGASFIGLAYCFDATDLSSIGATPKLIMNSSIILYVAKDLTALGKILGVDVKTK